jgi:hypothetical protein
MGEQQSFRMGAQSEKSQQPAPQVSHAQASNPVILFNQCYNDVINNRVQKLNPNIFKTMDTQNIPNAEYRNKKRGSVF